MDTLTAQVAERDAALVRVKDLESEIGRISKEREREIEKGSNYEDKCDSLQDEIIQMREELKGIKVKDKEQTSLISGLQEKLVKAEEEQKHHIDMRYVYIYIYMCIYIYI
jgi:predicted  nucleic acid-binding Zn-ribbon protein